MAGGERLEVSRHAEESILLVDDRDENLVALRSILEPLGHPLISARSGMEALKVLLSEEVSVILLDVRMPGMDGYETAEHIKRRERTSDIPIIFLTAESAESEQVLRAFSAGAVDFVTKPFEPWALRAKVQVFVDLSEKTKLLREQGERLRVELDQQHAREVRHLRHLADAALAINSTLALDDVLRILNDSAREVIGAHEAETVVTSEAGPGQSSRSRSYSAKYQGWAEATPVVDLEALYDVALEGRHPVRMTKAAIRRTLAARGVVDVAVAHPLLEGWLAVPLLDRSGDVIGLIQVADKLSGDFDEQDELVLVQLAQLASVAIENARRFHQEHEVAHTLQRSMLPRDLPSHELVELTARYRAGGAGTEVGGDWYDAVLLPDGRLLLVVGDVVGRGASAAAVMGQLRTGWRAYALHQFPLNVLMRSLDLLLQDVSDGMLATAVCLALDPVTGEVEVVSAGHPPPLVIDAAGTASYLACDPHMPLGCADAPRYAAASAVLPAGALLVLYTDGLVEGRAISLDDGMRRLAAAFVDAGGGSTDHLCDVVLERIAGESVGDDDVALLAVRLRRSP